MIPLTLLSLICIVFIDLTCKTQFSLKDFFAVWLSYHALNEQWQHGHGSGNRNVRLPLGLLNPEER